jgi:hypothetical protein
LAGSPRSSAARIATGEQGFDARRAGKRAARQFAIIRPSPSPPRPALKIMPEHLVQNWQVRKPLARLRANFCGNI